MTPRTTLERWAQHLLDRARATTFARFLWRRFLDDRLFESAGALSYTTVFALVPLSMVVFGVLSAFPVFEKWSDQLSDYVFSNFVPSSARAIETVLRELSVNAGQLTTIGVIALVISLLITLLSVEGTFNRIWRVKTARPNLTRFLVYWTVLTLGALVAAASLAISTQFFALEVFQTEPGQWLQRVMLWLAPMTIELMAFTAIYRVVPHRTVQWRHALAGALLALTMLELVKWLIGLYLGGVGTYEKIYGKIAFAPIFLLWVYFGWVSILLGASFAASVSAFRYQPAGVRLPAGFELYGVLRLLGRFLEYRRQGKGLHSEQILKVEPMLTDSQVQQMLGQLCEIGVVGRTESGEWILTRDLGDMTLGELYEACQLRIPIGSVPLPRNDDDLGMAALSALDGLRLPVRELLKRDVASLYPMERPVPEVDPPLYVAPPSPDEMPR